MKQLIVFLLLSSCCQAQILSIPDTNFKAKLLSADSANTIAYGNGGYMKIDSNNDGEIQLAEAMAVDSLNVPFAQIANMSGIDGFTNLKKLDCFNNEITSLNLFGLNNLQQLYCGYNQLATLDVSAIATLTDLNCPANYLTSLTVANLGNLEHLFCGSNQLATLSLTGLANLKTLDCANNAIASLNLSELAVLETLNVGNNMLTSLDATGLSNLTMLMCANNQITSLQASGLPNIDYLYCGHNQLAALNLGAMPVITYLDANFNPLAALDVTEMPQLVYLYADNTSIATLDVSGLAHLYSIYISNVLGGTGALTSLNASGCTSLSAVYAHNNQLASLDLTGCTALIYLNVFHNQLAEIDVSDCHLLQQMGFADNAPLQHLFLKNGANETMDFIDVPNLAYICADDMQLAGIQNMLQQQNITTVVCNSYCSFNPGGDYNTIAGNVTFDSDNNGCSVADAAFPLVKFSINDGVTEGSSFTGVSGAYGFYTGYGNFTIAPEFENPTYFTATPASIVVNFANNNNNTATENFCVTANGIHNDAEIVILPLIQARPGFDAIYKITYRNKGNQSLSGAVVFGYGDDVLDFVSSDIVPDTQSAGSLTWNYTNLLPFESRSFNVVLNANGPMETPPLNIDDVLHFSTAVTSASTDDTPTDNVFAYDETVVGSFDPNDKTCLEGTVVSPEKIGEYLHYNINFENTGTAAATHIVVKDDIDAAKFDMASLQMLEASHPVQVKVTGNKIEFIFENINLGENGHGNVVFKIRTRNDLAIGTTVTNKADIFFDYNFPIETNQANTTFQSLGNPENPYNSGISVYPNPAHGIVNVKSTDGIRSVQVFDAGGRIVATHIANENETAFDISTLASGIYYLKITTSQGVQAGKLVKE